jgi:hypothetical protein
MLCQVWAAPSWSPRSVCSESAFSQYSMAFAWSSSRAWNQPTAFRHLACPAWWSAERNSRSACSAWDSADTLCPCRSSIHAR